MAEAAAQHRAIDALQRGPMAPGFASFEASEANIGSDGQLDPWRTRRRGSFELVLAAPHSPPSKDRGSDQPAACRD